MVVPGHDDDVVVGELEDICLKCLEKSQSKRYRSSEELANALHAFLEKQPPAGLRRTQWLPDGAVRKAWLDALGLETEPELPLQVLIDPKGMLRCQVGGEIGRAHV